MTGISGLNTNFGQIQPQNTELEEIILGSVLVDFSVTEFVVAGLQPEDFYSSTNQAIFEVFQKLYQSGTKIDLVTAMEGSKSSDWDIPVDEILSLTKRVGTTTHIHDHIDMLKNISAKRKLIQLGVKATQSGFDNSISSQEALAEMINEGESIMERVTFTKAKTFEEEAVEAIKEIIDNEGQPIGISTGFEFIDENMSGLCAPDLTIIGASPGEGKSTLMRNMAKSASQKGTALIFSLEMKANQQTWAFLSDELSESIQDIRMGNVSNEKLLSATTPQLNIKIIDKGSLTVDELTAIVRLEKLKGDISAVFVDYLQLLTLGSGARRNATRNDEVTIISRKLKQLGMDLNIPVVALSQLNRQKGRKTYSKSDLRESGAIEQDADNIIFIYRPVVHGLTEYDLGTGFDEQVDASDAIIILDKCRLGQTGRGRIKFNGKCSRFENYVENEFSSMPEPPQVIQPNTNERLPF